MTSSVPGRSANFGEKSTTNRVAYSDPNRTLGTYAAHLGIGNTFADFMDAALQQERGRWNSDLEAEAVINYIREGFDLAPLIAP